MTSSRFEIPPPPAHYSPAEADAWRAGAQAVMKVIDVSLERIEALVLAASDAEDAEKTS